MDQFLAGAPWYLRWGSLAFAIAALGVALGFGGWGLAWRPMQLAGFGVVVIGVAMGFVVFVLGVASVLVGKPKRPHQ